MDWIGFADESGIHPASHCYGIGAFVVPSNHVSLIEARARMILAEHGINYELKWNRVGKSGPIIEASLAGINLLLNSGASFHGIIVEKATYRKWRSAQEEAFYTTYQLLASDIARSIESSFDFWIDFRSDSYAKRAEVMKIITNYTSARSPNAATLRDVSMVDSKDHAILQLTDVLIGAITADTHRFLTKSGDPLTPGKEEVIRRIAGLLGWERLCYDTFPSREFNVWHFPPEFRNRPGTRSTTFTPVSLQESLVALR